MEAKNAGFIRVRTSEFNTLNISMKKGRAVLSLEKDQFPVEIVLPEQNISWIVGKDCTRTKKDANL
ncbi:hypothetical protein JCM19239_6398 [Vibrio variabilis]|uniref:Uncharacterized protein n=1 Tax=Vibrio variabilis TaxID=990271 RepID=A0ABQ0JMD3_9VIBR|nr:hypothetical protein JCM19239_6398 [Vibrio variabilis]